MPLDQSSTGAASNTDAAGDHQDNSGSTKSDRPVVDPSFLETVDAGDIEKVRVQHPYWRRVLRKLEYCRVWSKSATDPYCMMIVGESGVGKSAIIDRYLQLHPPVVTADGRRVPVLKITTPSVPTTKAIVEAIIIGLVGHLPAKGTMEEQTARLLHLLSVAEVELIIIDEFQHVIEHANARFKQETSDWIKNLITLSSIPVVLVGMPNSLEILQNEQLRRRFMTKIHVKRFIWSEKGLENLKVFLHELESSLPFEQKLGLGSTDLPHRFYYASDGMLGTVMKIVRGAAHLAQAPNGPGKLTMKNLSYAYRDTVTDRKDVDPFLTASDEIHEFIKDQVVKHRGSEEKYYGRQKRFKRAKPPTSDDIVRARAAK